MLELFQKCIDTHNIVGAKIISVSEGVNSKRKGLLIVTKTGEQFHIDADTNLNVWKQIKYQTEN